MFHLIWCCCRLCLCPWSDTCLTKVPFLPISICTLTFSKCIMIIIFFIPTASVIWLCIYEYTTVRASVYSCYLTLLSLYHSSQDLRFPSDLGVCWIIKLQGILHLLWFLLHGHSHCFYLFLLWCVHVPGEKVFWFHRATNLNLVSFASLHIQNIRNLVCESLPVFLAVFWHQMRIRRTWGPVYFSVCILDHYQMLTLYINIRTCKLWQNTYGIL